VQDIFNDLNANGFILEQEVEQSYCEQDKKFLADRFVEGECPHCHYKNARGDQCDECGKLLDPLELINPKCKTCGSVPVRKKSNHLFLDLPKLRPKLEEWVKSQSVAGEWTTNAITTTQGWLQRGLEPRAITRDLSWGVPVPLKGFENKVFYVWFDAPIGYVSITGQKEDIDWREWWEDPENVRLYQFMAKDNIPFHTIIFPATQLGTGKRWTMLHHIDSTEYLQHEDGKFSKSRGIGLFGDDAMRTGVAADVFRYYLLVNRPESADAVFSWKDLQEKLNKELLANLGNLVNRTMVFIKQYQEGTVHEAVLDETSANFWEWVAEEEVQVTDDLERCREKDALRRIMTVSNKANQYFQEQQPWRSRTEDPESCRRAMFILANLIKDLAILLGPFLPDTSKAIFSQLGIAPLTWKDLGDLSVKGKIAEPKILFAKLEDKQLAAIKERLGAIKAAKTAAPLKPLQLRAGRIIEVARHPDASKLFIEQVDFGSEMRTIVSGLVGHYREDDLRGKTALFVTNLAPAKLRGVASNGMILCAHGEIDGKDFYEVVFVDAEAGTLLDGSEATTAQVTIDEFNAHTLEAQDGKVFSDGKPLCVAGKQLTTKVVLNGKVK